jgi:hypothetical protein
VLVTAALNVPHFVTPRPLRGRLAAPPVRLEEDWAEPPLHFRLVVPRAKRDRLDRRAQALARRPRCSVAGCMAEGLAVLLIEVELEALLCPFHQLVYLDGTPVEGEPLLAVAGW